MRTTLSEKIFYRLNALVLFIASLLCLLPLMHIISLSLSNNHAIMSGTVSIFPVEFTIDAYKMLIERKIVGAIQNSAVITLVGAFLSMILTILAAYPLSRKYFIGRRFFSLAIVFTMLFSGGMIPTYLLVKSLGMINSYTALWLPGLIGTYNMMVMRSFFENIPADLEESARIDGCSELRILIQIFLPLSLPVIATLSLFYSVTYWNSFFSVLLYIGDSNRYNLAVYVQQMISNQSLLSQLTDAQSISEDIAQVTPESIKAASIMVMVIPMLIVYPFLQRYFVKGVMLGAIKG